MFDMFEEHYLSDFSKFLEEKNPKLFAMLCLRHSQYQLGNELLKRKVLPEIQGVKTMQVFASLASANVQVACNFESVAQKMDE